MFKQAYRQCLQLDKGRDRNRNPWHDLKRRQMGGTGRLGILLIGFYDMTDHPPKEHVRLMEFKSGYLPVASLVSLFSAGS